MFIEYVCALVVSMIIDGVWLGVISKTLYQKYIGGLMLANARLTPAVLFYLIFSLAIMVFITHPALKNNWSLGQLVFHSALLGLVIYGGYDLTNLAILKGWSVVISVIDIAWGMVLTTLVSVITVFLSRILIK